jgi:outer membrane protein TolC
VLALAALAALVAAAASVAGDPEPGAPVEAPRVNLPLLARQPAQGEPPQGEQPPGEPAPAPESDQPGEPPAYELRVQECIERALQNNLDIALRRLTPELAAAQVTVEESVFDSAFKFTTFSDKRSDPSVSTLGGAPVIADEQRFIESSFTDPLRTGGSYKLVLRNLRAQTNSFFANVDPSYNSEWQIAFVQPLLKNFGPRAATTRLVVARNNHQISQSDFRQAVLDTLAAVEKAYWDLAFRILDLDVKKQSLQLAEDLLRLNRTKVQVGTLAPIEITQAEAGVADREEAVIVAQNEIRKAEDQLKRLLGPPSDPVWGYTLKPVDEPPFDELQPDLDQSLGLALANRPDLEKSRLTLRNREAQYRFAVNQRRLDLSLDASYGAKGLAGEGFRCDSLPPGVVVFTATDCVANGGTLVQFSTKLSDAARQARDRDADSWRVGLTLNVPVGNRDAASRYIAARVAREQAGIDYKILEQTATIEVRQSVRQIETDVKRVKAARVNSRLQKEKLDAEQKKFENGISTSFNVLTFQEDLAQARSREAQALTDYNKSRVELERVLGTLPQARSIALEP